MAESVAMPRYIDDPPMIMFWPADLFGIIVVLMGIGFALGGLHWSIAASYLITKVVGRYKDVYPDGFLFHMLYAWGLIPAQGRRTLRDPGFREYAQ